MGPPMLVRQVWQSHRVNAGVGSSTLPLLISSKIRFGVTPEINAISTIIVAVTAVAILVAWRLGSFRGEGESVTG